MSQRNPDLTAPTAGERDVRPPPAEAAFGVSDSAAVAQLRAFIASRGFNPGDRLPPERRLGAELGLRRTELRRALETMEREGALWRHVGKGTFLSTDMDQSPRNDIGGLAKRVGPADVMRARAALEPAIAREAAVSASAAAVAGLRVTNERARRAGSWREYEALDNEFHRRIAEAAGSEALLALFDQLNTLRRMVVWGRQPRLETRPPADHPSFEQHDAIVAALAACDVDGAQAAMRAHLRSVEDRQVV